VQTVSCATVKTIAFPSLGGVWRRVGWRLEVTIGVMAAAVSYVFGQWYAQVSYTPPTVASMYERTAQAPVAELTFTPPVTAAAATPPAPVAAPAPVVSVPVPVVLAAAKPASYANNYTWGNCTWYVATRRSVPGDWGNAVNWYWAAQAAGYKVGTAPAQGAIAWTAVNGVNSSGHVAYVEEVQGNQVYISEMNFDGGLGVVHHRSVAASAFRYIY
jgi:hypothetical protein